MTEPQNKLVNFNNIENNYHDIFNILMNSLKVTLDTDECLSAICYKYIDCRKINITA